MSKNRPPRVYYDKEKKQYYIRRKKKKIYFPVGTTKQHAQKLAVKQLEVKSKKSKVRSAHNLSINAQPLNPLPGFSRRKYRDSPLVVSYGTLQNKLLHEAVKIEALKQQERKLQERQQPELFKKEEKKEEKKQKEEKKEREEKDPKDRVLALPAPPLDDRPDNLDDSAQSVYARRLAARKAAEAAAAPSAPEEFHESDAGRIKARAVAENVADAILHVVDSIPDPRAPLPPVVEDSEGDDELAREIAELKRQMEEEDDNISGKGLKLTPKPENFKEQLKRDGLYSDQIAEMMKPYKKSGFLGVIASDEIRHLIEPSMQFDRFGWVMNTDPASKPGEHWVAVFIDLRDEKEINYYDSFAEDPPNNFPAQIKELIDSHDPPFYLKFKVNRIKQQAENSTLCGFHAMRFLIDRFHGKPFKECTGYSEVKSAEKQAGKMAKKYDKFGYI